MAFLRQVTYKLPKSNSDFTEIFLNYLSSVGNKAYQELTLKNSRENFFPITSILFTSITTPLVQFLFSDSTSLEVEITNITGESKSNPHAYSPITIEDFVKRVAPYKLKHIDHTGFNLPYFKGIHPTILELREKLKKVCLYHTFPKHLEDAPWDFILPATEEEINTAVVTDYSLNRKPKIEIVSFDKSSTPLIQLDVQLKGRYGDWIKIFPEAIQVPELKSLWVYVKNDFGIDVCFVLNEVNDKDWSYHFSKDRLN
jgi:hypothetical protein